MTDDSRVNAPTANLLEISPRRIRLRRDQTTEEWGRLRNQSSRLRSERWQSPLLKSIQTRRDRSA